MLIAGKYLRVTLLKSVPEVNANYLFLCKSIVPIKMNAVGMSMEDTIGPMTCC